MIKSILASIGVEFQHVRRMANCFTDALAKQMVDRVSNLAAYAL